MRALHLLLRLFGWLLTPLLAWAASFLGATAGTVLSARVASPMAAVLVTAGCGAVAGFTALLLWLRLLRRSPEVREALAVSSEGVPDTVEALIEEAEGAPTPRSGSGPA